MKKLRLSFLERDFFAEDRTGTTIRGYEPAIMEVDGKLKAGRVIDVEELEKAEFIDTLMFQTEVELKINKFDLEELLNSDKSGKEWLERLQKYFSEFFKKTVPMIFSMRPLRLPNLMIYDVSPKDYFERTRSSYNYRCPEAVIKKIPETAVYWKVEPPMKFEDGSWLKGITYSRNVRGPKGVFDSYANKDPSDKGHFYAEGVLLGNLTLKDLENVKGDFEGDTPLNHFLDMVYLAPIRHVNKYNPMTIRTELC